MGLKRVLKGLGRVVVLPALLCLNGASAQTVKGPVLEIGVIEDAALAQPFETLLREAFSRAGLRVVFRPMPLRRSEQELLAGRLDGDSVRAVEFFEQHPQLLRVRVPVREMGYFAVFKPPCPVRIDWHALAARPLAYLRGTHTVEAICPSRSAVPPPVSMSWGAICRRAWPRRR